MTEERTMNSNEPEPKQVVNGATTTTVSTINVATRSVTISQTATTAATTAVKPVEKKEPRLSLDDMIITRNDKRAFATLIQMFESCRPHDTKSTLDFGIKWLKPLGAKIDKRGNWTLRIGDDSKVLWSSHIDTVDWREGPKKVVLNHDTGVLRLSDKDTNSTCLGADCTTGVWIMREMALAKVPGLYVWHEAEESGGQGSSDIVKHRSDELLKGMQAAIAFDRKGFDNIITEQSGGQCCSDEFAKALALQLPDTGFKPDPTGTFTDTANYTDVIPECTNLSVGYFGQHFKTETQNVIFAMLLRVAMLRFDESKLVIKRKPGEGKRTYVNYYGYGGGGGLSDWWDNESRYYDGGYKEPPREYLLTGDRVRILSTVVGQPGTGAFTTDVGCIGRVTLIRYVNPKLITIKLEKTGATIVDLQEEHLSRIVEDHHAPVTPPKTKSYFFTGDRVRMRSSAGPELSSRRLSRPQSELIGGKGTVTGVGLKGWVDVTMDNGQQLFSMADRHFDLIAFTKDEVKPKVKDYSKTKCGGLCGGKCQGMCADPVKLDMLQRLAAKVKAEEEMSEAATIRRLGGADGDAKIEAARRARENRDLPLYPQEDAPPRQYRSLVDFVIAYPDQVADLIDQWGLDIKDLYDQFPDCL
jgi:hypothetical protein